MKFETLDDYYVWTCEWCDSINRTLWVKIAQGDVACGACHLVTCSPGIRHGVEQNNQHIVAGLC